MAHVNLSPRMVLLLATLVTAAYTAVVWWVCRPLVRHWNRVPGRRPW